MSTRKSITFPFTDAPSIAALPARARAEFERVEPTCSDGGLPLFHEDADRLRLSLRTDFDSGPCLLDGPIVLSNRHGLRHGHAGSHPGGV